MSKEPSYRDNLNRFALLTDSGIDFTFGQTAQYFSPQKLNIDSNMPDIPIKNKIPLTLYSMNHQMIQARTPPKMIVAMRWKILQLEMSAN